MKNLTMLPKHNFLEIKVNKKYIPGFETLDHTWIISTYVPGQFCSLQNFVSDGSPGHEPPLKAFLVIFLIRVEVPLLHDFVH